MIVKIKKQTNNLLVDMKLVSAQTLLVLLLVTSLKFWEFKLCEGLAVSVQQLTFTILGGTLHFLPFIVIYSISLYHPHIKSGIILLPNDFLVNYIYNYQLWIKRNYKCTHQESPDLKRISLHIRNLQRLKKTKQKVGWFGLSMDMRWKNNGCESGYSNEK